MAQKEIHFWRNLWVKVMCGNKHDYLATKLDYPIPGVLRVDLTKYVKSMIDNSPDIFEGVKKFPWRDKLFTVDTKSKNYEYKNKAFINLDFLHHFECKSRSWQFPFNHPAIRWSFTCIERSIETEMVLLKHSWNEQNHDESWEITHRKFFVTSKKEAGPTCYGVKQFLFLKHSSLFMIVTIHCSAGD